MVALGEYRKLLCPDGCGHLAEVSQAPENEDRFKVETPRCHAQTAILRVAQHKQEKGEPHPDALLYKVYLPAD